MCVHGTSAYPVVSDPPVACRRVLAWPMVAKDICLEVNLGPRFKIESQCLDTLVPSNEGNRGNDMVAMQSR